MNSDCCSTTKVQTGLLAAHEPAVCPACGIKGKVVATLTVKNLVRDHARVEPSAFFSFCRTADCNVVYFSEHAVFAKPDIKVRVGIKETADPVLLCYCFGYDQESLKRDVEAHGISDIARLIKAEVQAGFCACAVKNPAGTCCLGDVNLAVKRLEERKSAITVARQIGNSG